MKKPWYKIWWIWVIAIVVLAGIGAALGSNEDGLEAADKTVESADISNENEATEEDIEVTAVPEAYIDPEYEILDSIELISGSTYGDILVKSFSQNTSNDEITSFIEFISEKESFDELSIYSTEDAYKANYSSSYLDEHPEALNEGFIASWDGEDILLSEDLGY